LNSLCPLGERLFKPLCRRVGRPCGNASKQISFPPIKSGGRMNLLVMSILVYLVTSWNSVAVAEEADMYAKLDSLYNRIEDYLDSDVTSILDTTTFEDFRIAGWSLEYVQKNIYKARYSAPEIGPLTSYNIEFFIVDLGNGKVNRLSQRQDETDDEWRFSFYRTLGVPGAISPILDDDTEILFRFHGKNVREISGIRKNFDRLLKELATNMTVNAVKLPSDSLRICTGYCIVLIGNTSNQMIIINENCSNANSICYDFYPFIRTDNLKSLYADPEINEPHFREPVRLEKP
jgi:hypothetical protein